MTKKDRIAIVVSILYLFLPLILLMTGGGDGPVGAIILLSPLIAYWGYRFVKGDISFIKGDKSAKE